MSKDIVVDKTTSDIPAWDKSINSPGGGLEGLIGGGILEFVGFGGGGGAIKTSITLKI